jgi:hypothetical protein
MLGRTGNKCTSGKALSVRSACNSALPAILWKNFPLQKFQASYAAGDHLEEFSPSNSKQRLLSAILWKNFPRQKFQASYAAGDHLEELSPLEA